MSHETLDLETTLSVVEVARTFRQTIERHSMRQVELGHIKVDPDRPGGPDDFAGYAASRNLTSQWCVQIYIRDQGAVRRVELVILGSSTLAKVWHGTRKSFSLSAGRIRAVAVIDALKIATSGGAAR